MSFVNLSGRKKAEILFGVMLGMLLAALDQTIVGTALPSIVVDLHGLSELSWVVSAYLLASAISIQVASKLSDIYGRRTVYLCSITIFLIGSMLCGQAHTMNQLIAFRALQGLGGGFLLAGAFTVIADIFPPRERGRWTGLTGAVFGLASVIGPTLGGYLTDHYSWHWIFYINVPVGILALLAVAFGMPNFKADRHGSVDWIGIVMLSAAVIPLLLGLVWGGTQYPWGSSTIIGLFIGSAVGTVLFGVSQRYAKDPLLPLRYFKNRNFVLSNSIIFLTAAALYGGIIYIPIFVQEVIGKSATNSGVILIPMVAGVVVASILTGQITARTGRTKILGIVGLTVVTVAMALLSRITASTSNATIVREIMLLGLGLGATFPLFPLIVQNEFPPKDIGSVTGSTQFFRTIGGTVGTAVLGTLFNNALSEHLKAITVAGLPPQATVALKNPNLLQTPGAQDATVKAAPAALQPYIAQFFIDARSALALSIGHVYVVGIIVGFASLVLMLIIKEKPLRNSNQPTELELESHSSVAAIG